jgi:hypothetical protein
LSGVSQYCQPPSGADAKTDDGPVGVSGAAGNAEWTRWYLSTTLKTRRDTTPTGIPLEGVYDHTYWVGRVKAPESNVILPDAIGSLLNRMESKRHSWSGS